MPVMLLAGKVVKIEKGAERPACLRRLIHALRTGDVSLHGWIRAMQNISGGPKPYEPSAPDKLHSPSPSPSPSPVYTP